MSGSLSLLLRESPTISQYQISFQLQLRKMSTGLLSFSAGLLAFTSVTIVIVLNIAATSVGDFANSGGTAYTILELNLFILRVCRYLSKTSLYKRFIFSRPKHQISRAFSRTLGLPTSTLTTLVSPQPMELQIQRRICRRGVSPHGLHTQPNLTTNHML
jgi:hypothetical protein